MGSYLILLTASETLSEQSFVFSTSIFFTCTFLSTVF